MVLAMATGSRRNRDQTDLSPRRCGSIQHPGTGLLSAGDPGFAAERRGRATGRVEALFSSKLLRAGSRDYALDLALSDLDDDVSHDLPELYRLTFPSNWFRAESGMPLSMPRTDWPLSAKPWWANGLLSRAN